MLSVIVPTYNERDNVLDLADLVDQALSGLSYELLFIDDSTDDTPITLRALAARNPHVRVEHRDHERGLGTAVVHGFALARGQVLVVLDADGQHPPALLLSMLDAIEAGADVVLPSRYVPGGGDGGLTPWRRAVSFGARSLAWLLLPPLRRVQDPTSGFFMVRREVVEGASLQPIGWKILIEVLMRGAYGRVVEVPYRFQPRVAGASKLTWRESWNYLRHLWALRRPTSPRPVELTGSVPKAPAEPVHHG